MSDAEDRESPITDEMADSAYDAYLDGALDGYGDEGAGYDGSLIAQSLVNDGWTYRSREKMLEALDVMDSIAKGPESEDFIRGYDAAMAIARKAIEAYSASSLSPGESSNRAVPQFRVTANGVEALQGPLHASMESMARLEKVFRDLSPAMAPSSVSVVSDSLDAIRAYVQKKEGENAS